MAIFHIMYTANIYNYSHRWYDFFQVPKIVLSSDPCIPNETQSMAVIIMINISAVQFDGKYCQMTKILKNNVISERY